MKKNRLTSKQFKSAIVLLSLVLGYTISFSQNTYEKGYYVTNTSDTIRGYIDIRESMGNPLQLKFKKQQDQSNQQTLSVNEVASFLLENFAIYERFFVSLSMNDIRMGRSESLVETPSRKDTVFLKLLSKGKFLSLYSFRDDLKERFYIMPSNETIPVELIYEIKRILNGGKRIQETYKQQLYTEAAKAGRLTEDLQWKLKKARCDAHSLTNLVFYINESTESPAIKS